MFTSTIRRAGLGAVAAALLASAAVAVPAAVRSDATPPAVSFAPISHLVASTAADRAGFNRNGYNWSGYAKRGHNFKSVVASWVEPHVNCNSNNNLMAPWVGIDGYGSKTVEQTGVATWCNGGKAYYRAWYEMYPKAPVYYNHNKVAAGDHFTALVTRNNHTYTLSIRNTTRHWAKVVSKTLASARNLSAEAIIESPTASYPNFGKVTFTGVKVNGRSLGSYHPIALDASNKNGYEDHTSKISGGTKFSITFKRP